MSPSLVVPAQAGSGSGGDLDCGLRRNDDSDEYHFPVVPAQAGTQ